MVDYDIFSDFVIEFKCLFYVKVIVMFKFIVSYGILW